jgi:hypothetical protein
MNRLLNAIRFIFASFGLTILWFVQIAVFIAIAGLIIDLIATSPWFILLLLALCLL